MGTRVTPTAKRQAAANAFREIARRLEVAPLDTRFDPRPSADDILDSFCDVEPFTVVRPLHVDETLLFCTVCGEEAHNADCPVRTLEELWGILAHETVGPDESVRLEW